MTRLRLPWVVSVTIALVIIFSSLLIYGSSQVSDKATRRLPQVSRPNSGAELQINDASTTSTFPMSGSSQSVPTQSTPAPNPQGSSQPSSSDEALFPIDPIPCKNSVVHECSPLYCLDTVSTSNSCVHCRGVDMSQVACVEL